MVVLSEPRFARLRDQIARRIVVDCGNQLQPIVGPIAAGALFIRTEITLVSEILTRGVGEDPSSMTNKLTLIARPAGADLIGDES